MNWILRLKADLEDERRSIVNLNDDTDELRNDIIHDVRFNKILKAMLLCSALTLGVGSFVGVLLLELVGIFLATLSLCSFFMVNVMGYGREEKDLQLNRLSALQDTNRNNMARIDSNINTLDELLANNSRAEITPARNVAQTAQSDLAAHTRPSRLRQQPRMRYGH